MDDMEWQSRGFYGYDCVHKCIADLFRNVAVRRTEMEQFLNVAMLISLFCIIAAAIGVVLDQGEFVINIFITALIVLAAALLICLCLGMSL